MRNHLQFSDFEFEIAFNNCTLDAKLFSHEAHLRLAWIHINKYGIKNAIDNIISQIANFAKSLGETNKFNKTVTVAAIKAVHHFILKSNSKSFKEFMLEFPRLKYNFRELLSQHHSLDIFNLESAKSNYLEPDLLPFD